METTLNPKPTDPRHVLTARADEELAHAYQQITSAGEEIARAEEQLSRLERAARRAAPGKRPSPGRAVPGFVGLMLAAFIGVAAFFCQARYRDPPMQTTPGRAAHLILTSF